MIRYKFTIETVRRDEHVICIYTPECNTETEAIKKAASFAVMQMDEEKADFIKRVEVIRYEEDA